MACDLEAVHLSSLDFDVGDYIFFGRDHFKIYVIFLLGQGLEMFFSYFSSGMLVVIAAACFNSPGIIALCWNILYQ